jgi:hypothetical protein
MTKSQEELRDEYRSQLEAEDREFGAVMKALRLIKTTTTVDGLIAGMNAAGYSDNESKAAFNRILHHNDANKGTAHD